MFVVGVDGGGTKTLAVVLNEQRAVVGRYQGGSTNWNSVGEGAAQLALRTCIERALEDASVELAQLVAVCVGMSGVDRVHDKDLVRSWLTAFVPASCQLRVENDGLIALASGTHGDLHGIVVISGTGCIVLGASEGVHHRAQGWGPLLGDKGGGSSLGLECLGAIAHATDGGTPTAMVEIALRVLELESAWELIDYCYKDGTFEFAKYAQLARIVLEAAERGDAVALDLLHQSAASLVQSVQLVQAKVGFAKDFPVVLAGGNFTHTDGTGIYATIMRTQLQEHFAPARIVLPAVDPGEAAALLALATK
eukprot:TRINITY_DN2556_c0_g1_i1.p1 TRINITY_DN2556_c0_g1~~TRINITY_DN2556_c0_g1_i1.p1  ORF type:complete len:316 (-),score=29.95 TRINITY_DN2556_c0_g1_i1:318-1241(-)